MPKTDTRSVFAVMSLSMATPSCIARRKLASQKIIKRPRNIYLHILASIATVDGTGQGNATPFYSFIHTSPHFTSSSSREAREICVRTRHRWMDILSAMTNVTSLAYIAYIAYIA